MYVSMYGKKMSFQRDITNLCVCMLMAWNDPPLVVPDTKPHFLVLLSAQVHTVLLLLTLSRKSDSDNLPSHNTDAEELGHLSLTPSQLSCNNHTRTYTQQSHHEWVNASIKYQSMNAY